MTELLEKAFTEASKLPPDDQNALADWLLRELESEIRWTERLSESQDVLSVLAAEAIAENRAEQTQKLDPEGL